MHPTHADRLLFCISLVYIHTTFRGKTDHFSFDLSALQKTGSMAYAGIFFAFAIQEICIWTIGAQVHVHLLSMHRI